MRRWMLLITFGGVLSGCAGSDNRNLDIAGSVRSLDTGIAIVGANVTLSWQTSPFESAGYSVSTIEGGSFTMKLGNFNCVAPVLTVSAPGFKTETAGVDCTDEPQTFDFTLPQL